MSLISRYLTVISLAFMFNVQPLCGQDVLKPLKLNEPRLGHGKTLMQALKERSSARNFSGRDLPIEVLSDLLWASSGINRENAKLTVPSALNRQEIDIYAALKDGLYFYNRKEHMLEPVLNEDIREYTGVQKFTQEAPVNLIYVADLSRMTSDDESNDLYSAVDTGFISQNVYLFCASEGLATVVLGWVEKDKLARKMKLRKDQKIILTQPVGYPS